MQRTYAEGPPGTAAEEEDMDFVSLAQQEVQALCEAAGVKCQVLVSSVEHAERGAARNAEQDGRVLEIRALSGHVRGLHRYGKHKQCMQSAVKAIVNIFSAQHSSKIRWRRRRDRQLTVAMVGQCALVGARSATCLKQFLTAHALARIALWRSLSSNPSLLHAGLLDSGDHAGAMSLCLWSHFAHLGLKASALKPWLVMLEGAHDTATEPGHTEGGMLNNFVQAVAARPRAAKTQRMAKEASTAAIHGWRPAHGVDTNDNRKMKDMTGQDQTDCLPPPPNWPPKLLHTRAPSNEGRNRRCSQHGGHQSGAFAKPAGGSHLGRRPAQRLPQHLSADRSAAPVWPAFYLWRPAASLQITSLTSSQRWP